MTDSLERSALHHYEMRVGRKSAAVDDLLADYGERIVETLQPESWWFERVHDEAETSLRWHFRPRTALSDADVARHILFLDRLTLTAISKAASHRFGFVPRPPDPDEVAPRQGGLPSAGAHAVPVNDGPQTALEREVAPFEGLFQSLSALSLNVLRREYDEGAALRKDCAVTIAEYLLKHLTSVDEAGDVLAAVMNRWRRSGQWSDAYVERIIRAASSGGSKAMIGGIRRRFLEEHREIWEELCDLAEKAANDLSARGLLKTRSDRVKAFQVAMRASLNQLGFRDADIVYVAALVQAMGYQRKAAG